MFSPLIVSPLFLHNLVETICCVQSFVVVLIRLHEITPLQGTTPFLKRNDVVLDGRLVLIIQLGDVEFFELGDRLATT